MRDLETVAALPGSLRLGEPVASGPLALVPVLGGHLAPGYRLAAEAIADGTLSIGEIGGGQVPELAVRNEGELPVLLVEGEHLEGARQDRVLNVTVLVPARADTEIPVSCVEQGRWDYRSGRRFESSPEFSPSTLRAIKTASVSARRRSMGDHRSDQASVWTEVARKHAVLGSSSQTGAMRDAYEQRASDLEAMTRSFVRPLPDQTGVVVTVGGRAVSFDGFDKPETLAGLWTRLIRGYAMEALGDPEHHAERDVAERFVATIGSAKATAHDAVGLGTEVVLSDPGFVAAALVWEGSVVHVAAFADAAERSGETPNKHVAGRSWFRDRDRNGP
jgi:hypothetical protein